MSYYYNYYIGYRELDTNKIYPLGPYDSFNKLKCVLSRSESFASDLHELFDPVPEDQVSDSLRNEFEYEDYNGNKKVDVKYLLLKDLPDGDFVRTGYYLISDVTAYEQDNDEFDGFYERLSPQIYAAKLDAQLKFGATNSRNEDYQEHNASEYMFYAYPDYNSKEYECFMIWSAYSMLQNYAANNIEYVVLETEG